MWPAAVVLSAIKDSWKETCYCFKRRSVSVDGLVALLSSSGCHNTTGVDGWGQIVPWNPSLLSGECLFRDYWVMWLLYWCISWIVPVNTLAQGFVSFLCHCLIYSESVCWLACSLSLSFSLSIPSSLSLWRCRLLWQQFGGAWEYGVYSPVLSEPAGQRQLMLQMADVFECSKLHDGWKWLCLITCQVW